MNFTHELASSRAVFGAGALSEVRNETERLGGRHILLIADEVAKRHADVIAGALGSRLAGRIDGVIQHVPAAAAADAQRTADSVSADLLLCIGGGSAIGLAKAIALSADPARTPPILAVPTTHSGSECTDIWGETRDGKKVTGRDPRVRPRTIVYDPILTLSMPPSLTAASGMNAIAHAVEALYAPEDSPVLGLLAIEAVRALAAALPDTVAHGGDIGPRTKALYGSWLAGVCLGAASMGLHHKLAHVLGGTWNLPHGPTHAALLPYVVAHNAAGGDTDGDGDWPARLASALGADSAAGGLWDLAASIDAPTDLHAVGFSETAVDAAAAQVAAAPPANPVPISEAGVRAVLHAALSGNRPWPPHDTVGT